MSKPTEKIWRCDCGGPHFLSIVLWPDVDAWLVLEDPTIARQGLWWRLCAAWEMLRRGRHYWIELLLTPEIAHEVAKELERVANQMEEPRA